MSYLTARRSFSVTFQLGGTSLKGVPVTFSMLKRITGAHDFMHISQMPINTVGQNDPPYYVGLC